jgi:excisionase family DNA binding protein
LTPRELRDLARWLTKHQAADAIGVSTKTIEQWAKEKILQQARYRRPTGGPAIAVYHPSDVARLAAERRGAESEPFLLPADAAPSGAQELVPVSPAGAASDDVLRAVFAAALRAVTSQKSEKLALFVTVEEASAVTGLSQRYLRRLIKDGTLEAVRDRGWRVRRRDLEKL